MLDTDREGGRKGKLATPLPLKITMLDGDQGIFRIDQWAHPSGVDGGMVPSHLAYPNGTIRVHTLDLRKKRNAPIGDGFTVGPESETNAQLLHKKAKFQFLMTCVPGAPNNKSRFHAVEVDPADLAKLYDGRYAITGGKGPTLDVMIPPSENTARFGWLDDAKAKATLARLIDLGGEDPTKGGLFDDPDTPDTDESEMDGFYRVNDPTLKEHIQARAAEAMTPFADGTMGAVTTSPNGKLDLQGNMASASVTVQPSGRVVATHVFSGQSKIISALALMAQSVREIVHGILPFKRK